MLGYHVRAIYVHSSRLTYIRTATHWKTIDGIYRTPNDGTLILILLSCHSIRKPNNVGK